MSCSTETSSTSRPSGDETADDAWIGMLMLVGVFLVVCLLAMVAGRGLPAGRVIGVPAASALVGLVTFVVWSALLLLHVVHIEPLLTWLGVYRLEQPWTALIFFTPPVVAAAVFASFAAGRGAPKPGSRAR